MPSSITQVEKINSYVKISSHNHKIWVGCSFRENGGLGMLKGICASVAHVLLLGPESFLLLLVSQITFFLPVAGLVCL